MNQKQTQVSETKPKENLQEQVERLSSLLEISVVLNSTLDINRLLNHILNTAAQVLECKAASIMLYNEKRAQLMFTAAIPSDQDKLAEVPVPLEGSIAGTIFRENKPLLINDVESDPRHFTKPGEKVKMQIRNLIGYPMVVQDKVIGVLEALNKQEGFAPDDVEHLGIIASQAAVAIQNARLHHALREALNEVQKIDKIKSDFLAIASHELRTPLGVILGYASFLQEEAQGELSDHADMVLNSAMKLRSLVEDMTNMNMLRLGATDLEKRDYILQKIIQKAYLDIQSTAQAKGQTVHLELGKKPVTINADPEKLGLVFGNLLNNAIRFTPEKGDISVHVSARNGEVWTKVSDNGPGIPKDHLKDIFKEFYQVEDHLTRRYGGMGLGLAIAKGVVELHDGRIWAESEGEGKGTTFVITLPKKKS